MENNESLEVRDSAKLQALLQPMMSILDGKNIGGVGVVQEEGKVFIYFLKDHLSEVNKFILFKISYVYNETLFYSNDLEFPNRDRLEYWNPDGYFPNVAEECLGKKAYVFELGVEDVFTILSAGIMLANCLREQDPLTLDINKDRIVYDGDDIARHDRYIAHGCPDTQWLNLSIFLDKNNPLRDNPYAAFMSITQINTPVQCDNMIDSIMVGYEEKEYLTFNMDRENLESVVIDYFKKLNGEPEREVVLALGDVKRKILENK